MSVIPLVVGGETPTVVRDPDEFDRKGDAILISHMDDDQLGEASDTSNVSYDLRVGCEYKDHRDLGKFDLGDKEHIKLHPGVAVIIETEELVRLPRSRFACILPKVSLLQKGLSNTISKVDPGYNGHLLVTVFNLGKKTATLNRRERYCSLCVFDVRGQAQVYRKEGKRIEGRAKRRFWRSTRDVMEKNSAFFTALLILVNLIWMAIQLFGN